MEKLDSFEQEWARIEAQYKNRLGTDTLDDFNAAISKPGVDLVIFGAAQVGHNLARSLGESTSKLKAFCDNYKSGIDEEFQVPIISPTQLFEKYPNAIVAITASNVYGWIDQIYEQVVTGGIPKERIFINGALQRYTLSDFKKYHYDGHKRAYNLMQDETSRRILIERITNYLFYSDMNFTPREEQYFDDTAIQLTDSEVLVDGGCFNGNTVLDFIKKTNGKYAHVYTFEPDDKNFGEAKENLAPYDNIEIINKGLHSKTGVLKFTSGMGGGSHINLSGENEIQVVSLDDVFEKESYIPTLIKMDVEGAEKEALIGAANIIRKARPKFALCVYHKTEDVYELPQLIMEYGGDYSFTLRHYTRAAFETVLYAIPK